MNRPEKKSAMSPTFFRGLPLVLTELGADPSVGALVLTVTSSLAPAAGGGLSGALPPGSAEAVEAFRRVFVAVAACLGIALVAVILIEQRPLRTDDPDRKT